MVPRGRIGGQEFQKPFLVTYKQNIFGEGGVAHRLPNNRPPTHPGEMLLEAFLKPLGLTQTELAARLGVSCPRVDEIVKGRRSVTPDTALRWARVVGMSADFWLGLQQDWDLSSRRAALRNGT